MPQDKTTPISARNGVLQPEPGPNDFHLGKDGVLQPGLGKDEPTKSQRASVKAADPDDLPALKEELRVAEAALTEQRRAYAEREQEVTEEQLQLKRERDVTEQQLKREQELDARERAIGEKEDAAPEPKKKG